MSKREERERRRKTVVGSIIDQLVSKLVTGSGVRGWQKEKVREPKKRISMSVLPSEHVDQGIIRGIPCRA